jgi:hypothetical protein
MGLKHALNPTTTTIAPTTHSSNPKGPKEWCTLRKGRVPFDALHYSGSVRKLTKEKLHDGVNWPFRTVLLLPHSPHPHWTGIQLLDVGKHAAKERRPRIHPRLPPPFICHQIIRT